MAAASRGVVLRRVWGALSALGVVAAHLVYAPVAAAEEQPLTVEFHQADPVTAGDPAEVGFVVRNATDSDDGRTAYDLTAELECSARCGGLTASFDHEELGPGDSADGVVSGETPETPGELELTLTVGYVVDAEEGPHEDSVSASTTLVLTEPEPEPEPTGSADPPDPTPSPDPTGSPDPEPTGSPDPDPTESEGDGDRSSPPQNAEDPPTGGNGGSGGNDGPSGSGDGSGSGPAGGSVPSGPDPDAAGSPSGDLPGGLPTDPLDLPSVDLPEDEELPELPLVTPDGDSSGAEEAGADLANDTSPLRGVLAPGMLLLTLLLLLLFATPLAPVRRVRPGTAYRGRRRKGW